MTAISIIAEVNTLFWQMLFFLILALLGQTSLVESASTNLRKANVVPIVKQKRLRGVVNKDAGMNLLNEIEPYAGGTVQTAEIKRSTSLLRASSSSRAATTLVDELEASEAEASEAQLEAQFPAATTRADELELELEAQIEAQLSAATTGADDLELEAQLRVTTTLADEVEAAEGELEAQLRATTTTRTDKLKASEAQLKAQLPAATTRANDLELEAQLWVPTTRVEELEADEAELEAQLRAAMTHADELKAAKAKELEAQLRDAMTRVDELGNVPAAEIGRSISLDLGALAMVSRLPEQKRDRSDTHTLVHTFRRMLNSMSRVEQEEMRRTSSNQEDEGFKVAPQPWVGIPST